MGWPTWLLLSVLVLAAGFALAAWLIRFRYSFEYIFPHITQGSMVLSFLWWRKEVPFASPDEGDEGESAGLEAASPGGFSRPSSQGTFPSLPGQGGFLAIPWKEREARFRTRFKAAGLKWALDLAVWRLLAGYALRSGLRAFRFIGPSMEHLHVGSGNVLALGRFAAIWSAAGAMVPFLACPVEYGFNERPFSLRFRVSGRCTALGFLGFGLALLLTIPWARLAGRFRYCWRHPRLNRWQRRLSAAAGMASAPASAA